MTWFTDRSEDPQRPHGWDEWYRFACDELGFPHDESAEYANLRFVEEENRNALGGGGTSQQPATPSG